MLCLTGREFSAGDLVYGLCCPLPVKLQTPPHTRASPHDPLAVPLQKEMAPPAEQATSGWNACHDIRSSRGNASHGIRAVIAPTATTTRPQPPERATATKQAPLQQLRWEYSMSFVVITKGCSFMNNYFWQYRCVMIRQSGLAWPLLFCLTSSCRCAFPRSDGGILPKELAQLVINSLLQYDLGWAGIAQHSFRCNTGHNWESMNLRRTRYYVTKTVKDQRPQHFRKCFYAATQNRKSERHVTQSPQLHEYRIDS